MTIDWNLVATAAAAITAVSAVIALWLQSRWFRFSMGVDLWWRLEERFRHDKEMLEKRRKSAQALLNGESAPELDEILDFFEGVGFLARKRALDEEMIWNNFYNRTLGYWFSAQEHISEVRHSHNDKSIWMEYEYLINRLVAIEERKSGKTRSEICPSQEYLKNFLIEESKAV